MPRPHGAHRSISERAGDKRGIQPLAAPRDRAKVEKAIVESCLAEQAIEWLGKFMGLVRNEPYDSSKLDGAQRTKEAIALYRGKTCGVAHCEALQAMQAEPRDIL